MSTDRRRIHVRGLSIEIVRKNIKNLHLGVYPPMGRVRVAAPLRLSDDAVRLAVVSRLAWIRRRQTEFAVQPRQSAREMVDGESHYFQGRRYRLRVIEGDGPPAVRLKGATRLELRIRPGMDAVGRQALLQRWYRERLREQVLPMLAKWEGAAGVTVSELRIRKMKTRWGSCNSSARRIWLNVELAKKPARCVEYILVHEIVHLVERHHNERFRTLMDGLMPGWELRRDELNRAPLAHEEWRY